MDMRHNVVYGHVHISVAGIVSSACTIITQIAFGIGARAAVKIHPRTESQAAAKPFLFYCCSARITCMTASCCRDRAAAYGHCAIDSITRVDSPTRVIYITCNISSGCCDCAAAYGHRAVDSTTRIDSSTIAFYSSITTCNISSECRDRSAVNGHRAVDSITRISFFAKGANRITDTSGCHDGSAVNGYRTLNTCCRFLAGGCNFTAIDVHNTASWFNSSDADTCCTIFAATCIYGTTINVYSSATFI